MTIACVLHAKHIQFITEESFERSPGVSLEIELSRRRRGEQLTERAQNLRLPAAHHKIKGLRAKEPSLPDMLQSPCTGVRGQKQMQLFLPQPLQWQELTNLWSRGRMLCLQPADICKLLLQRCA